jgi:pimeloyl-ACP methyl ester carboxylesterase
VSLYAEATGPSRAPAVVFLHGVRVSSWMWWQQVPAFADHLCLPVDLPGHGRSRDLPWTSLADTADRVAALVRARTADGRAHVVGLSLGGQVALALLERHPDVVARAVVSGVTTEPWPHRRLLGPQAWLTTAQLRSRRLVDAQARALRLPPWATAEVAGYTLPRSLAAVPTPTLALAGARESELIRRAVETIPAVLPAAVGRVVPGVGHGWNVEAPDLFTATVRAWIEGRPLPAP